MDKTIGKQVFPYGENNIKLCGIKSGVHGVGGFVADFTSHNKQ